MNSLEIAQKELTELKNELRDFSKLIADAKQAEDFEKLAYLHERKGKLPSLIFASENKARIVEIKHLKSDVVDLQKKLSEAQETAKNRESEIGFEIQSIDERREKLKSESMSLLFAPMRIKDTISAKNSQIFALQKSLSDAV